MILFHSFASYKNCLLFSFIVLGSIACSSGGGDSDEGGGSTGFNNIEISSIPRFLQVNEGEPVTIDLNSRGDDLGGLTFDWSVGGDISFSGQNTDRIQFIAPEVDSNTPISISVEIDSDKINLLGNTRQMATLTVLDITPVKTNAGSLAETDLPEVDAIDKTRISDQPGRWQISNLEFSDLGIEGVKSEIEILFETVLNKGIFERSCDLPSLELATAFDLSSEEEDCVGEAISYKHYQNDIAARSELYCGIDIVSAKEISFQGSDTQPAYKLTWSVDDSPILTSSAEVCLITSAVRSIIEATDQTVYASSYLISGTELATPISIQISRNDRLESIGFDFVSSLTQDSLNDFTIISAPNTALADGVAVSGLFRVNKWSESEKALEWDINTYRDSNGIDVKITGIFTQEAD